MSFGFKIMAEGDYACFTRPEMKVERCSYDVMTPSAARGILEAIPAGNRARGGDGLQRGLCLFRGRDGFLAG